MHLHLGVEAGDIEVRQSVGSWVSNTPDLTYVAAPVAPWYVATMGHVYVKAQIEARRRTTVEFLVDTGATHTIIPPALADAIDAPIHPRRFTVFLADGRRKRLRACSLGLTVAGRSGPIIALLLPGSDPLLGVEALEALGLKVNPQRRCLEPTRAATALLVGVLPRHHRYAIRTRRA